MAKNAPTNQPVDIPAEQGGGIVHAEADFFGQPQRGCGFGVGLGGESAIGAAKGDRVREGAPPPTVPDTAEPNPFK